MHVRQWRSGSDGNCGSVAVAVVVFSGVLGCQARPLLHQRSPAVSHTPRASSSTTRKLAIKKRTSYTSSSTP